MSQADSVTIFISHKTEDEVIARGLKNELELISSRVRCLISEDFPGGAEWFKHIRDCIDESHMVLLIFTASTSQWDWPLYEVGLATDLRDPERCRIICLYSPGTAPPDPIKAFQSFEATTDGLEQFLHQLFCTNKLVELDRVLNDRLQADRLRRLAEQLSGHFTTVQPWSHCFTNYLWIDVEGALDNEEIQAAQVPASASIDPESTALSLFGLSKRPPGGDAWRWEQLVDRLDDEDSWVIALGERFKWAAKGSILKSMTCTFRAPDDDSIYRPLLHRVNLRRDGLMRFEVIFTEGDLAA